MTTKAEYDAGTAAALAVITADTPQSLKPFIPAALVQKGASDIAKAAIDAAANVRIKAQQQT